MKLLCKVSLSSLIKKDNDYLAIYFLIFHNDNYKIDIEKFTNNLNDFLNKKIQSLEIEENRLPE